MNKKEKDRSNIEVYHSLKYNIYKYISAVCVNLGSIEHDIDYLVM